MYSPNARDENGESVIPASQRPDGTWRKARRVKEGYVPQEEVPLYESKGKQFATRSKPEPVVLSSGHVAHQSIPGLFIVDDKEKSKNKKKNKGVEEARKQLDQVKIQEKPNKTSNKNQPKSTKTEKKTTKPVVEVQKSNASESTDPAKRLKNLKKRLREVEALEEKLKSGQITKPEPEQLTKVQRKKELLMQIREAEKLL